MTAPAVGAPGRPLDDERWPDELRLLLGAEASGLLTAVAAAAGGELGHWRATQVGHRPTRSTVVQYRVQVRWPAGRTTSETFVAATGDRVPPEGAATFEDGATRVAVWRWPADPFLPGLSATLQPRRVAALLDDLGIDGGTVQLRTRSYRPGRRAVVEATGRRGRLFFKVVPPEGVEQLHRLHRLLATSVPVPDSLGWTADGVLVQTGLPGRTLRDALRNRQVRPPQPEAIVDLLDRLPAELAGRTARRDPVASAAHYAAVIAATVPTMRSRVDALLDRLQQGGSGDDQAAPVPVHGDLYESQLLVDRGRVTGLLDIDTAGAGRRANDLATFCAHLSVLAQIVDRRKHVNQYGAALLACAERHHDPVDLRRRIAAAVVGLATGPFRVLEQRWAHNTARRLDLAAEWLDAADASAR